MKSLVPKYFLALASYWYCDCILLFSLLLLFKSNGSCYRHTIFRIAKSWKNPKNGMEVFCENQHFEICKKSIFSNFQFPPLMLYLKFVTLNQRFSKFGLVKLSNLDFKWYVRHYRGETKFSLYPLFLGHLLLNKRR